MPDNLPGHLSGMKSEHQNLAQDSKLPGQDSNLQPSG
jgi:hypothetical protein